MIEHGSFWREEQRRRTRAEEAEEEISFEERRLARPRFIDRCANGNRDEEGEIDIRGDRSGPPGIERAPARSG